MDKNAAGKKEEKPGDDAMEKLLCEQSRKQVRSDYRRSLGNEHGRRYLE